MRSCVCDLGMCSRVDRFPLDVNIVRLVTSIC